MYLLLLTLALWVVSKNAVRRVIVLRVNVQLRTGENLKAVNFIVPVR